MKAGYHMKGSHVKDNVKTLTRNRVGGEQSLRPLTCRSLDLIRQLTVFQKCLSGQI
jgi:hypothetical protein